MRKQALARIMVFLALGVILLGAKCPGIPETEEVEITLVTEEFIELTFQARGSINVDSGVAILDVDELRRELEDAGVEISRIDTLRVAAVEYGVVAYNEGPQDRQIVNGTVTVERLDTAASAVLIDGLNAMVYPLLGLLVPAPIEPGGIDFLNDLLADVLAALKSGGVSGFEVAGSSSGVSEPQERETNFDWRVRIYYHVSGRIQTEVPRF